MSTGKPVRYFARLASLAQLVTRFVQDASVPGSIPAFDNAFFREFFPSSGKKNKKIEILFVTISDSERRHGVL